MRRLALVFTCVFVGQLSPIALGEQVLERDLRKGTDVSGRYYLVFCARKSPGAGGLGHAFVAWAEENEEKQMSISQAFGFYPKGTDKGVLGYDVPGEVRYEAAGKDGSNSKLLTHRLIVQVNREAYEESKKIIDSWKTKDYNLYQRNCICFAYAVAKKIGVAAPDPASITLPSQYFTALFENEKNRK